MIRTSVALAAAALLLGGYTAPVSASILFVDDDGLDPFECEAAPFQTINAALAVASSGDEIRVCPGVYPEQVVLNHRIKLTGLSFGTAQPVIRPAALPVTVASLLGGNPITGGIIVNNEFARLSNLEVDLANASLSTCLPYLTGVYLRGASGSVERLTIRNVRTGGAACDSGVGLYVESGVSDEILGNPILAPARVNVRDLVLSGYQKAGLVANGPRTVVNVRGGSATGGGASAGTVQYGYQVAYGAKAKLSQVTVDDHRSLIEGKAAAGVLVFRASRVSVRKSFVNDSQEGVFGVGHRLRVKKTEFVNMFADGVVFIGDANLAASNLIDTSSVTGVFIRGDRNVVKGGVMRDVGVGVWFQSGVGNKYGGVKFENVPVAAQGISGGVRADLGVSSAEPFSTECASDADCDDANSCTTGTCDDTGHCTFANLAAGAACDDGNPCTTDTCSATGVCQGAAVAAGTACSDGNSCTTGDLCNATGGCVGTLAPGGTACDDGNPCTGADACNATGACAGPALAAGTACDDGNPCTLNDVCSGFTLCQGEAAPPNSVCDDGNECTVERCDTAACLSEALPDFTACAGGACMSGVCS